MSPWRYCVDFFRYMYLFFACCFLVCLFFLTACFWRNKDTYISWTPNARESSRKRRWGLKLGRRCPLPNRLGSLGSVVSSPAWSGSEPRSPTYFWHIWGQQNTSGRENSVTFTVLLYQFFPHKNPPNRRHPDYFLTALRIKHVHIHEHECSE